MRTRRLATIVALIAAIALSACAVKMKARLEQSDLAVYSALTSLQHVERDLFTAGTLCGAVPCVSTDAHKRFSGYLLTALQAGKTFHLTVMAWKPDQPTPIDVTQLAVALKAAADVIKTMIPDGPQKDQIGIVIDAATLAVNQALLLVLPKTQADALMPAALFAH